MNEGFDSPMISGDSGSGPENGNENSEMYVPNGENTSVGLTDIFNLDAGDPGYVLEGSVFIHDVRYDVESDGDFDLWPEIP